MSQQTFGLRKSFVAGGTITKGDIVKMDTTAGQVIRCAAATDVFVGVAQDSVSSGQDIEVQITGTAKITAEGNISAGNDIGLAATPTYHGVAVTLAAGGGTLRRRVGIALEAAADGEKFEVLITNDVYETA